MGDSERVVDWSDLPTELLPAIGKSLDTRIDVLRFRSVCTSWRSSIPPFHPNSPHFPLKFPNLYAYGATSTDPPPSAPRHPAILCQSTLYHIQPLNPPSTSSSWSNKGWLMKVEESDSGKLRLENPMLSNRDHRVIRYNILKPKTLNLLNFRVVELTKAYTLRFQFPGGPINPFSFVNKLVVFPNSAWTNADECSILMIFGDGKLGFAKCGDEKLTLVDGSSNYDDIIVYKGQFYVVDRLGIVSWVDCSSLKLVPFLPPLCGLGSRKHLVESCGSLYVVDRYIDGERCFESEIDDGYTCSKVVGFEVYKLDEEWGRWVLVKSLGDQAFVLSSDCSFSVSAREFSGYKGDYIHFTDDNHQRLVFHLKDHSIHDLAFFLHHSEPLWPPQLNECEYEGVAESAGDYAL